MVTFYRVTVLAQHRRQMLGYDNGAVPAACTSDRYGQVRFTLTDIPRQSKFEQVADMIYKILDCRDLSSRTRR